MAAYATRLLRKISFRKAQHLPAQIVESPADTPAVALAVAMEARLQGVVFRWFEVAANSVPLDELEDAVKTGRIASVLEVVDIDTRLTDAFHGAGLGVRETSFQEMLSGVYKEAAYAELRAIDKGVSEVKKADTFGAALQFDLLNPASVEWLRQSGGKLIAEISEDTRKSIADIVIAGFEKGQHPYEQARTIKQVIGLTQKQSRAVSNFRDMLYGDGVRLKEALTRELRDKRFDKTLLRTIKEGGALSREQADKMVARYYDRYKQYRAKMIARTETLRASNAGQQALWEQNAGKGLLPEERTRRYWITGPGSCHICLQAARTNSEGVRLKQQFNTELGPIDFPPIHPHCRCGVAMKFIRGDVDLGALLGSPAVAPVVSTLDKRMDQYKQEGSALRTRLLRRVGRLARADKLAEERMYKLIKAAGAAMQDNLTKEVVDELLEKVAKAEDAFWALRKKKQKLYTFDGAVQSRVADNKAVIQLVMTDDVGLSVERSSKAAATFLEQMLRIPMGRDPSERLFAVNVRQLPAGSRPYALPDVKFIFLGDGSPASDAVHEIGHIIEENNLEIGAVAKRFLAQRTIGEDKQSLKELTGKAYDANEFAKKDKFINPYIGKQYQDGYTEVTSMTLEMLYTDWEAFARRDPEMFDLMVGMFLGGGK